MSTYNVSNIEDCIESEYKELIKTLDDNLISIFIIGSMKNKEKVLNKYNDYDVRILVKEMDLKTYNTIIEFNKLASNKIKELGIDVTHSLIIGPARHITNSNLNLLIHCIPMTLESLESLPLTHRYSYSCNYRIIYGEDVLKKYQDIRFSGTDIIKCTEGIDYCINMINTNKMQYAEWEIDENGLKVKDKEKEMTEENYFEVLKYSLSKSLDNTMKWLKWDKKDIPDNFRDKMLIIDENLDKELLDTCEKIINENYIYYKENKTDATNKILDALKKIRLYIYNKINYIKEL